MSKYLEILAGAGVAALLVGAWYGAHVIAPPLPEAQASSAPAATETVASAPAPAASGPEVIMAAAEVEKQDPLPKLEREGHFGIGREALPEEIAAWHIDVTPSGHNLPKGQGSVSEGEELFLDNCAMCHGDFGEGVGRWPVLAGGHGSLKDERPEKTIGSYWPYLSSVFDYIRRAMPFGNARSLTNDQVYAITAYLLYMNDIVDEDFVLSDKNFLDIHLPNEKGFFMDDREQTELPKFTREPCMKDCKPEVKIRMRARVLDVTPDDGITAKRIALAKAVNSGQPAPAPAAAPSGEQTAAAGNAGGDDALIKKGEKVFKKCKSCHAVGEGARNKTGPQLNGVIGRKAASVEGFKYSAAMKAKAAEGLVWTEENLKAFLTKPKAFVPGTKMGFAGLRKESDIDALLAYLRQFGAQ
ncbi:MAG: MFS transporter [Alphaproteobacteria bacterium]|nr:MAG: MFS transporter [Alphaproteobacteria bacterium]